MLGKRKRDTRVINREDVQLKFAGQAVNKPSSTNSVFREYFEAQFAPLPEQDHTSDIDNSEGSEDESAISENGSSISDWSGLSAPPEPVTVVEVVDHTSKRAEEDELHRARQKAFMSARPPREVELKATTRSDEVSKEEDANERLNLKHDLDLQRLLKESHLLERSKTSSTPGKERQKALDMRLQALGAKDSLFSQQKMPMSHRIGINEKTEQKETRRRHEAKENGVILEKVSMSKGSGKSAKHKNGRRERGVDAPGVGKFSGGTLKLSRKDVASIQGPPAAARRGRRR